MSTIIDQIVEQFPAIQQQSYEREFNMLYEMLWEFNVIAEKWENEILYIESKRVSEMHAQGFEETISPVGLLMRYSKLAFLLAKEHCKNGKTFDVALQINEYFLAFVQNDFLTKDEKQRFRKEISETQLDFKYASGNDRFSSIRMAPYIRRTNR